MSRYGEAQKKATIKFQKKTYDCINLRYPKGYRDEVKAFAAEEGLSVNSFIKKCIDLYIDGKQKE